MMICRLSNADFSWFTDSSYLKVGITNILLNMLLQLLLMLFRILQSEKAMEVMHSSTLAWKIPWMEEPGRLQSMGSIRVRLN